MESQGLKLWELPLLVLLLAAANLYLLTGAEVPAHLLFEPGAVVRGEWWLLLTHPWVHLSWYHLLLDGAAFLLLYRWLREATLATRLWILLGCYVGSLAGAMVALPTAQSYGFCGLSGIAHGLMAAGGWRLWMFGETGRRRMTGMAALLIVGVKTAVEVMIDPAIMMRFHTGDVGNPIVACHLGGVIAAVLVSVVLLLCSREQQADLHGFRKVTEEWVR